jgi:hypothetical protein
MTERKFEFKLVKKYYDGTVLWEELPENANRRWKTGEDVELSMEWSNHKGHRRLLRKNSIKIQGLPSISTLLCNIVIHGPVRKDISSTNKYFNPFQDAENSDSDR